ncbi:hypothetical protein PUN28_019659 [Cardiocondyla obscurior]|uniref:Uncharacterized protein n=1 Tax=Cardiocondyla obscurior TaxID=286306 RepID=A0AAW2EAN0_9HYME
MIAGSAAAASAGLSASTVFLSLLVPALVLYYIYFKISRRHMIELAEKIPGPEGLPLIGNTLLLLGSSDTMFRNLYRKSFEYDQIIKLWLGPKLLIFLMDPRDVEIILSSNVYIDKSAEYRFFQPWLGNGLLISTGTYLTARYRYQSASRLQNVPPSQILRGKNPLISNYH